MIDLNKKRIIDHDDFEYFDETMTRINSLHGLQNLLTFYTAKLKLDIICEIGSYAGVSSELFAQYAGKLYCVDIWEDYIQPLERATKIRKEFNKIKSLYSNITEINKESKLACKDFPDNYFDLIYIDADHEYSSIILDIKNWLPKLKVGGILAGHDYWVDSVKRAVNTIFGEKNIKYFDDSSWSIIVPDYYFEMFKGL